MSEYKEGDVVVMKHPLFYDTHVVALVVAPPTKAMITVDSWRVSKGAWAGDPTRRNLRTIVGIANDEPAKVAARLSSAYAELAASRKRADQSYIRAVQSLSVPARKGE